MDPRAAILEAIALHFQTAIPGLEAVLRGFPESDQAFALDGCTAGSVLSVHVPDRLPVEWSAPFAEDSGTLGPGGLTLWHMRCGYITGTVQIDLWSTHRAVRDRDGLLVEEASHSRPDRRPGLDLTSAEYYNRQINLIADGASVRDVDDTASRGEWRQTWTLDLSTDLIIPHEGPKSSAVTLLSTYQSEGLVISEPSLAIP